MDPLSDNDSVCIGFPRLETAKWSQNTEYE